MKKQSVKKKQARLTADQRREAILDAARDLFFSQGYASTSLEDVVAKAGGSLATVYQMFGNKEGLWKALVKDRTDRLTEPMRDGSICCTGEPRAVLRGIAQNLRRILSSQECGGGYRLVMAEGLRFPEIAATLIASGPDAAIKMVRHYLKDQHACGTLNVPDAGLAAEQFVNLVAGDVVMRNACGMLPKQSDEETTRRVDAAVELFLKGYAQPREDAVSHH